MSLTTLLSDRNSHVRQFIDTHFPHMREFLKMKRRELKRAEIMPWPHQMSGDDWGVVGAALDYRLRFYWGLADPKELVAYGGALIASAGGRADFFPLVMSDDEVEKQSLFRDFFTLLDDFTDAVQREDKLNVTDEDMPQSLLRGAGIHGAMSSCSGREGSWTRTLFEGNIDSSMIYWTLRLNTCLTTCVGCLGRFTTITNLC